LHAAFAESAKEHPAGAPAAPGAAAGGAALRCCLTWAVADALSWMGLCPRCLRCSHQRCRRHHRCCRRRCRCCPFFLTTVVDAFSSVDNVQMCPVSIAAEEGGMHIDRDAQICSVQQKGKPNENFQPKQTDKKQLLDDLKKEECGEWVNYVKSALTIASGADSTAARGSACDACAATGRTAC